LYDHRLKGKQNGVQCQASAQQFDSSNIFSFTYLRYKSILCMYWHVFQCLFNDILYLLKRSQMYFFCYVYILQHVKPVKVAVICAVTQYIKFVITLMFFDFD